MILIKLKMEESSPQEHSAEEIKATIQDMKEHGDLDGIMDYFHENNNFESILEGNRDLLAFFEDFIREFLENENYSSSNMEYPKTQ